MITFGPVPSRRLGQSLGINTIRAKTCSYSCVYCQIGRTNPLQAKRQIFFPASDVFEETRRTLDNLRRRGITVDYLTFVPQGEPTLDAGLGHEIEALKSLGIKVAVITNGSLLWREDVRAELLNADWVSVKLDAVQETTWRRINRPYRGLEVERIIEGMFAFAGAFKGTLVTETMMIKEFNDSENCANAIAGVLQQLHPSAAYILTPTRPPAESWVEPADRAAVGRASAIFRARIPHVRCFVEHEGTAIDFTGDLENQLLDISAVHPLREDVVAGLLEKAGATWDTVEHLLTSDKLAKRRYGGSTYFVRTFH